MCHPIWLLSATIRRTAALQILRDFPADPDPRHVAALLDGLPGALHRAPQQGLEDAKAGPDDGPGRPLSRLPRLGPELGGRWSAFRFVLDPWRWMLVIYAFLEEENRVVVVTVQGARSSRAVRSGSD